MKNILVTGGAGFIGSFFIKHLCNTQKNINIINFDILSYAGDLKNLETVSHLENYHFIQGDIRNRAEVEQVFSQFSIDTVVHFAAESHVDRSIHDPEIFITTNVLGTQILLDTARKFWRTDPQKETCTTYQTGVQFLQVSTDEVYGALGKTGFFTETTPLSPNSPYSASKASADHLVSAYFHTYQFPCKITRCSNNYGPHQFPEKLIPLMIHNALKNEKLPVYGDGLQVRDWLHVKDHCTGIWAVLTQGTLGEVYNIGGNNEKTNLEIVKLILKQLDKPETLISFQEDRLGHDRRYAIDNHKITTELGWKPSYTFENGIKETISWYLEK